MHISLKKITAFTLLILVATPFIFSIYSAVKFIVIKKEMDQALENEQLQTLTVSQSDIKWLHPGKEMLINGRLFDVKSFKQTENILEIKGLFDEKEESFQQLIISLFHHKQTGNSNTNTAIVNLFFQALFTDKSISFKINREDFLLKKKYFVFAETLVSSNSEILIPPPKI